MTRALHFGLFLATVCWLTGCGGGRSEIKTLYVQWHGAITQGKFDEAYLLMTEDYRSKNTVEQFRDRYTRFFPPPPLSDGAVVRATAVGGGIVPAPQRTGDVLNGRLYGVTKVGNVWRFTGVDGGHNEIIGVK
jgi:hypothetical protein